MGNSNIHLQVSTWFLTLLWTFILGCFICGLLFGGFSFQSRNLDETQMSLSKKPPLIRQNLSFYFSLASYRLVSSLKFHRNSRNLTPDDIYSSFYVLLQNQNTLFLKIASDVINFLQNSLWKWTKLSWLKYLKRPEFLKKTHKSPKLNKNNFPTNQKQIPNTEKA